MPGELFLTTRQAKAFDIVKSLGGGEKWVEMTGELSGYEIASESLEKAGLLQSCVHGGSRLVALSGVILDHPANDTSDTMEEISKLPSSMNQDGDAKFIPNPEVSPDSFESTSDSGQDGSECADEPDSEKPKKKRKPRKKKNKEDLTSIGSESKPEATPEPVEVDKSESDVQGLPVKASANKLRMLRKMSGNKDVT